MREKFVVGNIFVGSHYYISEVSGANPWSGVRLGVGLARLKAMGRGVTLLNEAWLVHTCQMLL